MSNNYTQIFTKGLKSALLNTAIVADKLRLTIDTHELYFDNGESRVKISDIIIDYTEEEIKSLLAPLPKLYLSSDTHKLFIFDDNGECVEITTSSSNNNLLPENCETTFNDDGTVTEITPNCTITTEIIDSKNIKETFVFSDGTTKVKTTTISDDGKTVTEIVQDVENETEV